MFERRPNTCHLCGQPIFGRYLTYDNGLIVCERCDRTTEHCSQCGLPSRQLTQTRDGKLCPSCLRETTRCALCNEPIIGSHVIYNKNMHVCERCNTTVPRCSRCNMPSLQLTKVRGKQICPSCLQGLPICGCCQLPILGKSFIIGDSPTRYCEQCMTTRPRCGVCSAPINAQGKIFAGDVVRCATCLSSVVMTRQEAERLYAETAALLKRELALAIPALPTLHLVERPTLMMMHGQAPSHRNPDTPGEEEQHLRGFFQSVGENRTIYIEQYLPQMLFRAVAAHELAHAWQSFYAPSDQPAEIVEGFAEWVAYRSLLALGQQREAARLTRRDDLYGKGLQYFIALERQQGRQGIFTRATMP